MVLALSSSLSSCRHHGHSTPLHRVLPVLLYHRAHNSHGLCPSTLRPTACCQCQFLYRCLSWVFSPVSAKHHCLSTLASCFSHSRIGVLAYRDTCPHIKVPSEFSGWYTGENTSGISCEALLPFVDNLETKGRPGRDQAMKAVLAHTYQVMRPDATTLILLYADAPPHMRYCGGNDYALEQQMLANRSAFGQHSHPFAD